MKLTPILEVVYTPEQIRALPQRDLAAHTAVVIDILRATSTVVTGLANGAEAFFPVVEVDDARKFREQNPGVLIAGERKGDAPEGFDFGNNPLEFTEERVKGKKICHTTTNGTQALIACRNCRTVVTAAFLNMTAVVDFLRPLAGPVLLVCAGTHEDFALEDGLAAGMIASELNVEHPVRDIYRSMTGSLAQALRHTRNGLALLAAGREAEVKCCAQIDQFKVLPFLQADGWVTLRPQAL
jgi:2-phosphosulfolactate phosphatase